jgi:hypothetical protein
LAELELTVDTIELVAELSFPSVLLVATLASEEV